MPKGAFLVSPDPPDDPGARTIMFRTAPDLDGPIPDEQLALQDAVERTLVVLESLFPNGNARFFDYYRPLLSLAQAGLVGPHAQPELARRGLLQLQDQVVVAEAAIVKNRYMKQLGMRAILLGAPALFLGAILRVFVPHSALEAFLYLWASTMVGVWLSFGARKTTLGFFDLHILEDDRLEPTVRLVFAGVLALLAGLVFSVKITTLTVGQVDFATFETDPRLAALLGAFAGLGEKLLSQSVAKKAGDFMTF